METFSEEFCGSSINKDETRSIWDSDGDQQVAFDAAPTWDVLEVAPPLP